MAGFALRRLGETVARRTTAMKQVVQRRAVNSARPAQRDFSKGAEKQTGIWARYQDILRHGGAPAVAVKSLTASIMLAGGDIACQTLMEGKSVSGVGAASLTNAAKTHENSQGDDAAPADPHGAGSVDLERVARFTSLGAFLVAPTLHIWCNIQPFPARKHPRVFMRAHMSPACKGLREPFSRRWAQVQLPGCPLQRWWLDR
jgi:hypothetical protein